VLAFSVSVAAEKEGINKKVLYLKFLPMATIFLPVDKNVRADMVRM
jgi:hypothetical protein